MVVVCVCVDLIVWFAVDCDCLLVFCVTLQYLLCCLCVLLAVVCFNSVDLLH